MDNPHRPTILVVDPDPAIRTLILALMRREGYTAEAAGSAEQALALHGSTHPSAVVVEPRIAGGIALLDALQRGDGDGRAKPGVIVVTTPDGHGTPYAGAPGVRAVLLKPFRLEELTDAVAACCDGKG
jgi:CheY-like chemotaxis protein